MTVQYAAIGGGIFSFFLLTIGSDLAVLKAGSDPDSSVTSPEVRLILPLQCRLTETCWVANYVDAHGGIEAQDFRCGPRTYDGHDGIDIAVRDLAQMQEGVSVVAAASGTVRAVRQDMADVLFVPNSSGHSISGRECGNGAIIDHGGGWQTQYCHLRRGSLRVHEGERVDRGHLLGLVGISGKTQFPHVHFTVRHHGAIVDPYTGLTPGAGCQGQSRPLWEDVFIGYEEAALYNVGFTGEPPKIGDIRNGHHEPYLDRAAQRLVLWVDMLGVQEGDRVRFRINGPDGLKVLESDQVIVRTQARAFRVAEVPRKTSVWSAGHYSGEVTLHRLTINQDIAIKAVTSVIVR